MKIFSMISTSLIYSRKKLLKSKQLRRPLQKGQVAGVLFLRTKFTTSEATLKKLGSITMIYSCLSLKNKAETKFKFKILR